jgi:hypothetical protein
MAVLKITVGENPARALEAPPGAAREPAGRG